MGVIESYDDLKVNNASACKYLCTQKKNVYAAEKNLLARMSPRAKKFLWKLELKYVNYKKMINLQEIKKKLTSNRKLIKSNQIKLTSNRKRGVAPSKLSGELSVELLSVSSFKGDDGDSFISISASSSSSPSSPSSGSSESDEGLLQLPYPELAFEIFFRRRGFKSNFFLLGNWVTWSAVSSFIEVIWPFWVGFGLELVGVLDARAVKRVGEVEEMT